MKELADRISRLNEDLSVERYLRDGAVVFFCRGAFSLVSHRQLDDMFEDLRRAAEPGFVFDLREVGHIDSTGIGTLAMSLKYCMGHGKTLVVVPNNAVKQALVTATLDAVFLQCDSVEAALKRLAAGR